MLYDLKSTNRVQIAAKAPPTECQDNALALTGARVKKSWMHNSVINFSL